jgi:hypothetical protein
MSARVSLRPRDFGVAACALRLAVAEAVRSDFVQCFRGVAPALGRPSTDASLREGGAAEHRGRTAGCRCATPQVTWDVYLCTRLQ